MLTSFALGGQLIFRMFGITLPAFEVAGGLILLLIGLDMLQAKRSATQEVSDETEEAAAKEDAGIVPLGIPMLAGPGAISSVMVLVGQVPHMWAMADGRDPGGHCGDGAGELLGAGGSRARAAGDGRNRHKDPGTHYGAAAGGVGYAVFRQWIDGLGLIAKP